MSSTQRFLRQRQVGTRALTTSGNTFYVFVAGSGNYVGNYPNPSSATPGYLEVSTPVIESNAILRDMGKTIKAGISTDSGTTIGAPGFFREVQVIAPQAVASATASTTFGVGVTGVGIGGGVPGALPSGNNAGDAGYSTYYIAIAVDGVIAAGATLSTASLVPDGQL